MFSFMTCFTQCSETSFTLPPERSEGGSKSALSKEGKDGLGNERYWRATGAVCGGSQPERKALGPAMSRIRDLATDGVCVDQALSRTRDCGVGRTQSSTAAQSATNDRGFRTAGDPDEEPVAGLGSA